MLWPKPVNGVLFIGHWTFLLSIQATGLDIFPHVTLNSSSGFSIVGSTPRDPGATNEHRHADQARRVIDEGERRDDRQRSPLPAAQASSNPVHGLLLGYLDDKFRLFAIGGDGQRGLADQLGEFFVRDRLDFGRAFAPKAFGYVDLPFRVLQLSLISHYEAIVFCPQFAA